MIIDKLGDDEALKVAMNLEEEGIKFYSQVAESVENEDARRLFNFLAEEEKRHFNIFKELHKKRFEKNPDKVSDYDDDKIKGYLAEVIKPDVFSDIDAKAGNPMEAIDVGILVEEKSIEFYTKVQSKSSSSEGRDAYGAIINEEKKHKRSLQDEKDKLTGG